MSAVNEPKADRGYIPLADHGLIGNLRTAALVRTSLLCVALAEAEARMRVVESYCVPNFDSPSIFARILDDKKGGHFSITPTIPSTTKQNYTPNSNVLQTKFLNDQGVATVTDYLPRQAKSAPTKPLLTWLIRRVEVIRGTMPLRMECAPAFDYARAPHTMEIVADASIPTIYSSSSPAPHKKVLFASARANLALDLRYVAESLLDNVDVPAVQLELVMGASDLRPPEDPFLTKQLLQRLLDDTNQYWNSWIRQSTYEGAWKEAVHRSALALKLLIYEPTGACTSFLVRARATERRGRRGRGEPTFSLPEYIGGTRNWDYRASWIRDSSFTLYALIRLGFTYETNAYMEFILERLRTKNPDGSLSIMYTIHGEKIFPEEELTHLDGHKGSKPVRIGNGAIDHVQLDIYGELVDYVIANYKKPDLSIWEVRNRHRHFTYSKVMMWVAIDRGLRLADKRSLPCPRRMQWLAARDELYEEIMNKAWNPEQKFFAQSYEDLDILDSSLLIMPLVFFMPPSDPRFLSTLKQILYTPERGGLTSNGLVYRYDVKKTDDGVGGDEGTFCLCTLWCVEALARAGEYDKAMLSRAVGMFEDFLQYTNHVGLCTEEISAAGEALGNAVQGFTHVTLISAAYNLSRMLQKVRGA
ncbi:hypothetical protein EVJ58_g9498 [Rhodofomes roseus]|uniref:Uncharacterized protein n=1 Tax=Rhodofomes roseus TaxID=34475 RepID=A0A4Y9XVA4_9APHY|nr:hypothetical protein EVJ58_g9498 [Rhodofomes roseus]